MEEGFFLNDTATTEIYTLPLPYALPILAGVDSRVQRPAVVLRHGRVQGARLDGGERPRVDERPVDHEAGVRALELGGAGVLTGRREGRTDDAGVRHGVHHLGGPGGLRGGQPQLDVLRVRGVLLDDGAPG